MLDHETNAYLCDVERGKPMHALLKRYWLPAAIESAPGHALKYLPLTR